MPFPQPPQHPVPAPPLPQAPNLPLPPNFNGTDPVVGVKEKMNLSELAGGNGGQPFQECQVGQTLMGVEWDSRTWRGQLRLGVVRPTYEPSTLFGKKVAEAPDGYAVGAIRVWATEVVNGMQLVYMRVKSDDSLDTNDTRESEWLGRPPEGTVKTLSGNGKRLCGLYGRKATVIDALGIVIQPEQK